MFLQVSNAYGGEIATLQIIDDGEVEYQQTEDKNARNLKACDRALYPLRGKKLSRKNDRENRKVQINGYIETNNVKMLHLTSYFVEIKDSFCIKLPAKIIPSFKSHNFSVYYECVFATPKKEKIRIEIYNDNIYMYEERRYVLSIYSDIGVLLSKGEAITHKTPSDVKGIITKNNKPYYEMKKKVIDLHLNEQSLSNEERDRLYEACKELYPMFSNPNIVYRANQDIKEVIVLPVWIDGASIATISMPRYAFQDFVLNIKFKENIKITEVLLDKYEYEGSSLVHAENVMRKLLDTDMAFERTVYFSLHEYTVRNFIFRIEFVLFIKMDGNEIKIPIEIIDSKAL
ncbi:hypothetical protein ENBRE01_0284 [Enteropsectra breve]|nr:hypothetical protein ENBRE01_0284 [Enteropsectra breve]